MAELPRKMAERFVSEYGLTEYDASQLTQSQSMAAYFENVAKACGQPKLASNWIMGELSRRLNTESSTINTAPVQPPQLAAIITRVADRSISNNAAKQVFDLMWAAGLLHEDKQALPPEFVDKIIEEQGLKQMNDASALEAIVDEAIAANAKNVAEFKGGNEKALNGLVGQIMKASKGKANPQQVNDLLRAKLGST
jgi:aspartyl-tRNA(Asn)/glutamyl-tRNA(Gln) amidotransferase subunit B